MVVTESHESLVTRKNEEDGRCLCHYHSVDALARSEKRLLVFPTPFSLRLCLYLINLFSASLVYRRTYILFEKNVYFFRREYDIRQNVCMFVCFFWIPKRFGKLLLKSFKYSKGTKKRIYLET